MQLSKPKAKAKPGSNGTKLEFKGFRAAVEVLGSPLRCFAPFVDKKEKTVSCWIASKQDRRFVVRIGKDHKTYAARTTLFLDGKESGTDSSGRSETGDSVFRYVQTSRTTERPFVFSPLEVTNDDEGLEATLLNSEANASLQKIGEIKLRIERLVGFKLVTKDCGCENCEEFWAESDSDYEEAEHEEGIPKIHKVHETSNKVSAVPHQVSYGKQKKIDRNLYSNEYVTYTDVKEVVATFIFRYRPIEVLRTCGIAPPEPPSLEPRPPRLEYPGHPPGSTQVVTSQAQPGPSTTGVSNNTGAVHPNIASLPTTDSIPAERNAVGEENDSDSDFYMTSPPPPLPTQQQIEEEPAVQVATQPPASVSALHPPNSHESTASAQNELAALTCPAANAGTPAEPHSPLRPQSPVVQIRQEETDDGFASMSIALPPASLVANSMEGIGSSESPGESEIRNESETSDNFLRTIEEEEEEKKDLKPDLSFSDDNEDDEAMLALKAQMEQLRQEKRKKREAAGEGPRKRVKREQEVLVFFKPGEEKAVVDLT